MARSRPTAPTPCRSANEGIAAGWGRMSILGRIPDTISRGAEGRSLTPRRRFSLTAILPCRALNSSLLEEFSPSRNGGLLFSWHLRLQQCRRTAGMRSFAGFFAASTDDRIVRTPALAPARRQHFVGHDPFRRFAGRPTYVLGPAEIGLGCPKFAQEHQKCYPSRVREAVEFLRAAGNTQSYRCPDCPPRELHQPTGRCAVGCCQNLKRGNENA